MSNSSLKMFAIIGLIVAIGFCALGASIHGEFRIVISYLAMLAGGVCLIAFSALAFRKRD